MIKPISNSRIIYEGPSMLDGSPIIAVITGLTKASKNTKTDAMLQTFIIRADMHPREALDTGSDISICGACVHRPTFNATLNKIIRSCYVRLDAVGSVYKAYTRGRYARASVEELAALGAGRAVRLGSYGDPMAVPVRIWQALISRAEKHTGYTHQWQNATDRQREDYQPLCMASADDTETRDAAQAMGWRTFRVSAANDIETNTNEILCPASKEAGHKTSCSKCGLCTGSQLRKDGIQQRPSVAIPAHGNGRGYVAVHLSSAA